MQISKCNLRQNTQEHMHAHKNLLNRPRLSFKSEQGKEREGNKDIIMMVNTKQADSCGSYGG